MADNNELAPMNFNIENTMELGGPGSTELLEGLLSPESVTTPPEKVEKVEETAPAKKAAPKKEAPKEEEVEEEKIVIDPLGEIKEDEEEEEEEEVVKKETKKTPEATSEEEDDGEEPASDNKFAALAKDLFNLGVFSKDEDEEDVEIATPEQFLERFNVEKKKGAIEMVDNFIGQFGEDYQHAFNAIFVKGVDPKEYFGTYNNIENYASLDLSDENNQIAVVRQALADQGFEAEDITAEVERIKNYGDLENVAQKHHKVLVKKEAAKLAQLEQESQMRLQQQAQMKQLYVKNVQTVLNEKLKAKEFDGIPVNPKLATELQDFLLVDKYKTPSGETLTDFDKVILDLKRPENHEKKVKVALLLKILEKDPTLSTIQKTGVSKKSDTLFNELARQTAKSSMKSNKNDKPVSWFDQLNK